MGILTTPASLDCCQDSVCCVLRPIWPHRAPCHHYHCPSVAGRLRVLGEGLQANWVGRQQKRAEPGWVARGPRHRHKQSVSHKHGRPHQPAATQRLLRVGKVRVCLLALPRASWFAGHSFPPSCLDSRQLPAKEGGVASRGPWILCSACSPQLKSPTPKLSQAILRTEGTESLHGCCPCDQHCLPCSPSCNRPQALS